MNPFRTNESPKCTASTCDMHKRRVRWRERWPQLRRSHLHEDTAMAGVIVVFLLLVGAANAWLGPSTTANQEPSKSANTPLAPR